jgi:hypothetical protein
MSHAAHEPASDESSVRLDAEGTIWLRTPEGQAIPLTVERACELLSNTRLHCRLRHAVNESRCPYVPVEKVNG